MISKIFSVVIRRFFEMLITCGILSAVAVTLNITGIFETRITVFFVSFIGAVLFFCFNTSMLRNCYFDLKDRKLYFIANYISYALFGICTVVVYLCFSSAVYGWIFAITKFLKYTTLSFSTVGSAVFFHLLGGLMILLAPMGMSWIFMIDDE